MSNEIERSWPKDDWVFDDSHTTEDIKRLALQCFDGSLGITNALVIVKDSKIIFERYDGELPQWDANPIKVEKTTKLLSWSMAKSVLHAVIGTLVLDGRISVDWDNLIPAWQGPDDNRKNITVGNLLSMTDGLCFREDYVDGAASDVIEMLFGEGKEDVFRFASSRGLCADPGMRFNYSSGTSNILSGIVANVIGKGGSYESYMSERLFLPIGMTSAIPTFDKRGTWVASSYLHATARDFAKFGYLYLQNGLVDGKRILPIGWVEKGTTALNREPTSGNLYGHHWWVCDDDLGSYWASGYEGQVVAVSPSIRAIIVRLGKTQESKYPELKSWWMKILDTLR